MKNLGYEKPFSLAKNHTIMEELTMQDDIRIILDTDFGPDCDDAGSLALLHILSRKKPVQTLAITNCTSNPYANGAIDVLNKAFGVEDIPIGMYDKPGFLWEPGYEKYNKYLCQNYENRFKDSPEAVPGAYELLIDTLKAAADKSITFVAIGPLNNCADLIRTPEGRQLVAEKVDVMITMSCGFKNVEWNVEMDIPSAREVFADWPTPILATPAETGNEIITGRNFYSLGSDHPLVKSYELYIGENYREGRPSWDLTAVWAAIMGPEPFFTITEPYNVSLSEKGETICEADPNGKVRFLLNKMPPKEIGAEIDKLWGEI